MLALDMDCEDDAVEEADEALVVSSPSWREDEGRVMSTRQDSSKMYRGVGSIRVRWEE